MASASKIRDQEEKAAVTAAFFYFIVGIENSAPARRPVGQRAVIVFMRV